MSSLCMGKHSSPAKDFYFSWGEMHRCSGTELQCWKTCQEIPNVPCVPGKRFWWRWWWRWLIVYRCEWSQCQIPAGFSVVYLGLLGRKKYHILSFSEVLFSVSAWVLTLLVHNTSPVVVFQLLASLESPTLSMSWVFLELALIPDLTLDIIMI